MDTLKFFCIWVAVIYICVLFPPNMASEPKYNAYHGPVFVAEIEIFKMVQAEVSAYTSSVGETDSNPFETASGETVYDGGIACPGRSWFGRKIEILDRVYTCNDVMNKRYRGKMYFDIWMENRKDALEFGRQTILVGIKQ